MGRAEIKLRRQRGGDRGQTLIIIMLAMPLFLSLMSLVVDGGNILVHKRNVQVASDAAALAIAQSIDLATGNCNAACSNQGRDYAKKNGVDVDSSWHQCSDADPADPTDTNCWAVPYIDKSGVSHPQQVEVRLTNHVTTFIAGAIGLYGANVSARAVALTSPVYGATTTPGTTIQGTTTISTIPGGTHTTTDPDILSGGSGVAFTMSRLCTAITYTGAGSKGADVLGAFATNGGLDFGGGGNRKKITWLAFDQRRCGPQGFPASPPSGTSQCQAVAWNDPTDSDNLCVKTLVGLNSLVTWPLPPPTLPTPKAAPWNEAADYPSKCINLGSGNVSFNVGTQPAGIYCVTGAGSNLQIQGVEPANSEGHTFFALGGATIGVSSNGSVLKFYWPSACGPRPTQRSTSYSCFGNITGYDSMTLLDSTYESPGGTACAVCLSGQNNSLTGDIFAPKPDVFPPSLTQTGGLVSITGGALQAGSGFFESWLLRIGGNTGSYSGTGASIVIPGQTHTTTDPDTTTTVVIPGTTIAGTVLVTTSATTLALDE